MTTDHARKNAVRAQKQDPAESHQRANATYQSHYLARSAHQDAAGTRLVLEDFSGRYAGVTRDSHWGVDVYRAGGGRGLPRALAPFAAPAHSWGAFVQAEMNQVVPEPQLATSVPPLHGYQQEQVMRLVAARRAGAPGFLWGLPTGSGKTPMAVRGACALAERPSSKILVITRRPVIAAWRQTIDRFATAHHRWAVVNPERLAPLLTHSDAGLSRLHPDAAADHLADEGISRIDWDMVIIDECHMLANPQSRRTRLVNRLRQRNDGSTAFTLWASATPFTTPEESAYVAPLIAYAAGIDPPSPRAEYRLWLKELGLRLNTDRQGRWYQRSNRPDVERLTSLLYAQGAGSAATAAELHLPEQFREVRAIQLSAADQQRYARVWEDFRRAEGLAVFTSSDPGSYRVEALRRVQKASRVKAPHVARIVAEQVGRGRQVVVPMWFVESIDEVAVHIARALRDAGLPERVVTVTGRDGDLRELKRLAFQRGEALVMVFNAVEGINAQADESLPGGKRATSSPRVCVIADVLTGGKRALQAEGRAQRDGQRAPVLYVYAAGTGEADWTAATFRSLSNTLSLNTHQQDAATFAHLAETITGPETP